MNQAEVIISHSNKSAFAPTISMSNNVMKKLKIPSHTPILFTFSGHQKTVICQTNNSKTNTLQVDTLLANEMGIPDQLQIRVHYSPHTNQLRLGPILAILVNEVSNINTPFAELNSFCEEVIHFARNKHIFAYVSTLENMLKDKDLVQGWVYMNGKWKKGSFPLAQIVYNRISSRKVENSEQFQQLKKQLTQRNIILFNQTFLNKWDVQQLLESNQELLPYLPPTQLFQGPITLKTMMEKYSILFIKPIHGSLGRGIYRITKHINGFTSQYTTLNGEVDKFFSKLSQLYNYLSKRIKLKNYIIQKGLPLMHFQGRTVDIRALMQKNNTGQWSITSMVARIGPENKFVSNVSRGGELSKVSQILKKCGIENEKNVRFELAKVAKKICETIENKHPNQFGELGIDLAVNQSGQIYLLEVNSKPSKSEDTVQFSNSKGRPSVHRLLDYILYLDNQNNY